MIHKGERNRDEKLELIAEFKEQDDIMQAKRVNTLFVCNECGLIISFEPKEEKDHTAYMSCDYNDFRECFENDPDYKPFTNNYKNTYIHWGNCCDSICLDCGSGIENEETICEKCGSLNIVVGNELA